jgi:hypothetical protein
MGEQFLANTMFLVRVPHLRVSDQGDVFDVLDAHYSDEFSELFVSSEPYSLSGLAFKLGPRHVRFSPTVGRYDTLVGYCRLVYDRIDRFKVHFEAFANPSKFFHSIL